MIHAAIAISPDTGHASRVLTDATVPISNTATQVIGYTVHSGTLATGTTYSIEVSGNQTTSTGPEAENTG